MSEHNNKNFEEFKARFANGEFDEQFKQEVKSPEDVVAMAKKLGYEISLDDVLSAELDDAQLEMVAGGKNNRSYTTNNNYNVSGEGNMQVLM